MTCRSLVSVAFLALLFVGGCDSGTTCLPAIPGAAACPADLIVDTSVSDPICLSAGGEPLCRGSVNATCYICSGDSFDDNCLIRAPQQTIECVHDCSKC